MPSVRERPGHTKMGDLARPREVKTLVTKARTIYRFTGKSHFNAWADAYPALLQKHRGNVRQLLGYDPLPSDRDTKGGAHDYFLLEDTTWMYHRDSRVVLPLFGSQSEKFKQLQRRATLQMGLSSFKTRLLNPGTVSKCGWWSGKEPASVARLADGCSLFNLPSDAAAAGAPQLPDFAAGWRSVPQEAIELESAASSHSPTAGSREVSLSVPNAWSSRCTRIEPLPRPKRSTWRGMRADRVRDRFSCAGEHVRGRVRRKLVLGDGWES